MPTGPSNASRTSASHHQTTSNTVTGASSQSASTSTGRTGASTSASGLNTHVGQSDSTLISISTLTSAIIQSPAMSTAILRTINPHDRYPTLPSAPEDIAYISLRDLRIGNESDAHLVTLPDVRLRRLPNISPNPHPGTDNLQGRAFLSALGDDTVLPDMLRVLCKGHKLARNMRLSDEALANHEKRLRLIASECRQGSADFCSKINQLSDEALTFCGDRTDYFVEQMNAAAILQFLSRNRRGQQESMLYNLGIAYCKLNALREELAKIIDGVDGQQPNTESVEDFLNVEFLLQEKLGLPTRHRRPEFAHTCRISAPQAETLAQKVIDKLLNKDGIYVFDFMSQWEPWIQHLEDHPLCKDDFEKLRETFTGLMEGIDPTLNEAEKMSKANQYMDRFCDWKSQLAGQKTREILMNVRADLLATQGRYPQQFNEVFE